MPKRTDIKSILIIGAGPIVIGQACEFDYAGTQACKALKEEGYRIILVNSNPATIMTDPEMADATYIEPLTIDAIERIIAKERPDALLPTLGGQTALNCTLELAKAGILEKYKIELIGASLRAIELAENRGLFQNLMKEIGLEVPHAIKVHNQKEAKAALSSLNLPVVIRPSFTLGGSGAGIAASTEEFEALCAQAFAVSPLQEVMIDEALVGWKEFELEVIRDQQDNCIIVCGVENLDPLGIHTGDSITVAPIQTLTDKEYQAMRQAAFLVLRAVGVDTGGSNVQFAVHPQTGKMVVIEMNPRVSRSSALVSKASGFPIAKIAAKLAVGYTLNELKNDITGDQLPASFEPSLDYVVVKIPRFNLEKFPGSKETRGPQMRSVGEVMAIGRTFTESLQKAMRSLEISQDGFGELYEHVDLQALKEILKEAGPMQLWAIGAAMRQQMSVADIHQLTHIDPWFLAEIEQIIKAEIALSAIKVEDLSPFQLKAYKRLGFADSRLAHLLNSTEESIFALRKKWQIHPVYKRIDSCAGEFRTPTAYLYSTYEQVCEAQPSTRPKMLIIGSGPNRIGQGIEFDYCCVQAAKTLSQSGYETIMVNCNPETVSTDYDVVDRLYCAPLTLEEVLAIIQLEKPLGVFVQYGGQTPLQLAKGLSLAGVPLLGVDLSVIEQTEDRQAFQHLLQSLKLKQPKNHCVYHLDEGLVAAKEIGFPLIVRPSFVLGGAAMAIVNDVLQLKNCLKKAFALNAKHPVLLEQFLSAAIEVDVDAIADGEQVMIPALLEHVEAAGVHSGDSACITPPVHLPLTIQLEIKKQVQQIAARLSLRGVFNVQFAVQDQVIYILEVNPRASRTLPFLCKATGLPWVQIATQCVLNSYKAMTISGLSMKSTKVFSDPANELWDNSFYCVKEAVLPFKKFSQTSAILGPEMKSTGEVMGIGGNPQEAYAKAQLAAGNLLPRSGHVWLIAKHVSYESLVIKLEKLGFKVFVNGDFAEVPSPCVLIIALTDFAESNPTIEAAIRFAVDQGICHATTLRAANALIDSLEYHLKQDYQVISLQERYAKPKHLLTGEELTAKQIEKLLQKARDLKQERALKQFKSELMDQHLALIFDKPSLRTRFSFTVAMRELGGDVIDSVESTRKTETPEDHARVLSGYCHGMMVRTHEDSRLLRMSRVSKIPIINGLSNLHHPCQILADLLTLLELFGKLQGLTLSYIGDGNNILHSLLLLAPPLGVNIHYCCPETRGPDAAILARSLARTSEKTGQIRSFSAPKLAVKNANAVYTDVWTSMGFEDQSEEHLFSGFQVNENLMAYAKADAVFMHCLPMERGKEVSETLPEHPCSVIFQQSENRLHVQKALLLQFLRKS